jgi:hypothetical protein
LSVGTIEPRKNHALLLQAFDRLSAKDAGLVIVGRKGWMADETLASLTGHPDFGKRVFWLTALDEQALLALYRNAYATVLPSHYEGYGLPVVEALSQGCVTVASDAGSLPEIATGHAVFFRRGDGEALSSILDKLYGDPDYYARLKASAKSFRPTPWQEAGRSVAAALGDIASGASHHFGATLRQMVFLSVHPERLDLALQSVRENLKFIDRIVVLTKPEASEAIAAVAARHFPQAVILTDDAVAGAGLPADATRGSASASTLSLPSRRTSSPLMRIRSRSVRSIASTISPARRIVVIISKRTWRPGLPARRRRQASTAACATRGGRSPRPPTRPAPMRATCRRSSIRAWSTRSSTGS